MRLEVGEKRVLTGFAVAYRFVHKTYNEAGKVIRERGTISFGPRMIQVDALPSDLADSIEAFLLKHMEELDE